MHPDAPSRNVILAVATLILCTTAYKYSLRLLKSYLDKKVYKKENAETFIKTWQIVWKSIIGILVIIAASGSFALLGLTVGFIGTILGWSLQAPIRGVAAWVMIVLKKPFSIGDRIAVAGVVGDVIDIQLNHIILNQVGGTVSGEESSGRGILVPNAILFSENVINYKLLQDDSVPVEKSETTMLDEVLVKITFDSDYEFAKAICIKAASEGITKILGNITEDPFVRSEFLPSGVLLRVRYKTVPAKRQEVSSCVTEHILAAVNKAKPRVKFRYPVNVTGLTPAKGSNHPLALFKE
jgi:small-conductance mechanosensitive channel